MSEALSIDIPFAGPFGKRSLPCLIEPMKTNTTASPVMDSHPLENFTADFSVFQAHLPGQFA